MAVKNSEAFHDEVVLPTLKKYIHELDHNYRENKALFQKELSEQIEEFLSSCSEKPVRYLHLSWLRSPYFIAKEGAYIIEAYSKKWYEDIDKRERMITFNWVFEYIGRFHDELEKKRSSYRFLPNYVCEQMVSRYFHVFQSYIKAILPIQLIPESMVFCIGEYHGESEPVSIVGIKKNSSLERIQTQPEFFMYHQISDFIVEEKIRHQSIFTRMIFSNAQLLKCDFQESLLVGTQFINSQLNQTNFTYSYLQDSRFESCDCQGCDFRYVEGDIAAADSKLPSYFGVSFQNSDLSGSDFRFAKLNGADFTNAKLVGAKFMQAQQLELNLTAEQIEQIEWIES